MAPLPTLTTFIGSLAPGAPFRVSIHSWETPKPSQLLMNFKSPDENASFEARVYLDGTFVAQKTFKEQTIWPEIIGEKSAR